MHYARKLLLVVIAVTAMHLAAPTAQAVLIPGGKIYATGGNVTVTIHAPSAAYTSHINLYLISPDSTTYIANSQTDVGNVINLGPFDPGEELIFGIYVTNTGLTFKMGDADRNPDNVIHNLTEWLGPNFARVHFEDLHDSVSDHDFNDVVFDVCGAISPAPAPAGLALMAMGGLGLGACRIVRRRKAALA